MSTSQTVGIAIGTCAVAALWLGFIADAARRPRWAWRQAGRNKATWIVVQTLLPVLGTVLYLSFVRRGVVASHVAGSTRNTAMWNEVSGGSVNASGRAYQQPIAPPGPFIRAADFRETSTADLDTVPRGGGPSQPMSHIQSTTTRPDHIDPSGVIMEAGTAVASAIAPVWAPDPSGRHQLRYWDGNQWTEHVADAGRLSTDPAVD